MTDITLAWRNDSGEADWIVDDDGYLLSGEDLQTSVILSLFTDRVDPDYLTSGGKPDHRGWWADIFETSPIGSRLWQLQRVKITDRGKFLLRVNDLCREALQWMITEGVVSSIAVSSKFSGQLGDKIDITIKVQEPHQSSRTAFTFAWAWGQI